LKARAKQIVREAYPKVRKYRDGRRTKDTWLKVEIAKVLERKGIYRSQLPSSIIGRAVEMGALKVVRDVHYLIPYAYKKHRRFRGWKGEVSWRVLELT